MGPAPMNGRNKWITRVIITPISGVISPLLTGDGTHLAPRVSGVILQQPQKVKFESFGQDRADRHCRKERL